MATQTQKENKLKALAKKWLQDWLSKDEIVTKLQPVADQKVTAPETIVETPKTSVDPKWVDAIWVPQSVAEEAKMAENAGNQQEQASQWEIQTVPDPQSIVAPQWAESTQTETVETPEVVQNMPVMLNLQTSSPIDIARGVKSGQVSMTDFNELAQSNPELYQLAKIEKEKQDLQDRVNQWEDAYFKAIENLNKQFEQQIANVWGGQEAVDEFKAIMPKNKYGDQLKGIAEQIANIDNARRTVVEDTERETGNADLGYIMAKVRDKDQLMMNDRTLLVAEYGALQSQYEIEQNAAIQQYQIYKEWEAQKKAFEAQVLEREFGMTQMAYEMGLEKAGRELAALESQSQSIIDTQRARAEMEADNLEFERDVALENMRRERDRSYEMQIREMDFDDKVMLINYEVQQQAAILDNKLRLENEWWLNTKTFEDDDGNVVAYDPATNKAEVVYSKDMVIPTGVVLTHSWTWRKLDSVALPSFSKAYEELQAAGFGSMVFAEWHRDQATTIQSMAARHWVAFDASNPDNTAATLRWMWHLVANVWMSDHEEWLAIDVYADWSYAAPTQEQVAILKKHGWKQTAGAGDMWHFEFVWIADNDTDTKLSDKEFTQANQVINSFRSEPQVKVFEEAYSQSLSLLSSINDASWPWDVAAIFSFMKSLDPQSVVRESEFELAAKSAWVAEYWKNTYERVKNGEKLSDDQRRAFGSLAKQFILDKATIYDTKYNDYTRRLEMQWITTAVFPTSIADQMREALGVSKEEVAQIPSRAESYKQSVMWGVVDAKGNSVNSEDILNAALQLK